MCGVNAVADFVRAPRDGERTVTQMNAALAHRGPDGEGIFASRDDCVVLGSRRLSIVDVAGGAMPIVVRRDGSEYAIVANAEFFNYREVRAQLEKKYEFKTRSDVEVALYAYIEWGEKCVEKLRGQFAFVIYDGRHGRVFLARDRFGIKPLYYYVRDTRLIVSSEPKGILTDPDIERVPDRIAIADYFLGVLALGKSEPLDRSFFEGVRALPPGSFAFFDAAGLRIGEYFRLAIERSQDTRSELASVLKREVERAVREEVPDEVPYGLLLSGGVDSSIIAALSSASGDHPLVAATLRYEGSDNPDLPYAKQVSERFGIALKDTSIASSRQMDAIEPLVLALDRPFDSIRELGLFEMYGELQASGCRVALIGEGSDEFNLGYYFVLPGFKEVDAECSSASRFRDHLWSKRSDIARYFNPSFIDEALVGDVINEDVRTYYEQCDSEETLDRMQYYYVRKFLKGRLDMQDRCSMAHSIEARVPFCDEMAAEVALAVPARMNLEGGGVKAVLRKAFSDALPQEVAGRPKFGLYESTDPRLYRRVIETFDKEFDRADPSVWEVLSKEHAEALRVTAEQKVSAAEAGEPHTLAAGVPFVGPSEFRMRHLFLLLVFLRWYRLYFTERVFA